MKGSIAHKNSSRTTLTQEDFERLLAWLDPDRETAGKHYEQIRGELIGRFRAHGCEMPEDLADETINRVARKLCEIASGYVGDRRPYFFRVAYYIHLEYANRRIQVIELDDDLPSDAATDDFELEFECLEKCLSYLPEQNREIIVTYYQGERRTKIELRKHLAGTLGIDLPALRLRAQRIREKLKVCILDCLESASRLDTGSRAVSQH